MAIGKSNNEQKILLGVSADVSEAEKAIQELEKSLDKLQDVKINASGDELIGINNEIKETEKLIADLNQKIVKPNTDLGDLDKLDSSINAVGDAIDKANGEKIKLKTDDKEVKNTILSIEELEEVLNKVQAQQRTTKDPLKLQQLANEAQNLKAKITEAEDGFFDTNQTIGILEDKLYAMAQAGQAGSQEFNEILNKTAQLKKNVIDVDLAVDALSTDKWGKFLGVGESMVGVFGGVTASLQLMGIESKTAEESIAKLMQLQQLAQGLQQLNQFRKQWTALMTSISLSKKASKDINAVTESISESTEGTKALTTATASGTVATKASTVATRVFGGALKAIGIGLIVSAVAYLVTNFGELKDALFRLIPSLKVVGDLFTKVGQAITDFVGITSDASRALDKLVKNNLAVIDGWERQNNLLVAMGGKEKEIYENNLKIQKLKRQSLEETGKLNKKLTEEELTQLIEVNEADTVFRLEEKKRLADLAKEKADKRKEEADKAKADYLQQLTQLKGYLKEAEKVTYASNNNARKVELKNIVDKYKEQIALAKKLNKDTSKLEISQKIERNLINKKYDDEYFNYIKNNQSQFIDSFSKEYLDTITSYNDQKKNATNEQKADLDTRLNNQLVYLSKIQQLALSTREAEKDFANASFNNEGNDDDKIKKQREKLNAQLEAEKEYNETILQNTIDAKNYENEELERIYKEGQARLKELQLNPEVNANDISILQAELNAKLSAIESNNRDIEDATVKHNLNLQKSIKTSNQAKKKLDDLEYKNKLENLNAYGDAMGDMASIMAEHTIGFKALAVSEALINTYASIAGQLKAFAGVPIPGYAIAQAIATGAVGFANVAKILSVKVDGDEGSGNGNTPNYSAPVINTTQLRSSESGIDNLNDSVNRTNESLENNTIKAYIVDRDLNSKQEKDKFYQKNSTY